VRRHLTAAAFGTAAFLLLLTPAGALAQEETGETCVANATAPNRTLIGFDPRQVFPTPLYELENRVITSWKVQVAPGMGPLAQQLVTFQQVGESEDRKTGESAVEAVAAGSNEFPTRLPVRGFHPHVGLSGPAGALYCAGEPEMLAGVVEGAFGIGETRHYKVEVGIGAPVTVTVEPDRDGDGYGDLTQDRCPGGASFGSDCPIRLSIPATAVRPHAIVIEAGPSATASLEVFGQVSWRAPKGDRLLTIGLSASAPVTVSGGTTTSFRLPLPGPVLRRLARLSPRHALAARLTIRVTDGGGAVTEIPRTISLRGRKERRRKAKA
jgi:hypothetical protein